MRDFCLTGLLDRVAAEQGFQGVLALARRAVGGTVLGPLGLPEPARPAVVAALSRSLDTPILWITAQPDEARAVAESLQAYLPHPERVHTLPAPDALPFERIPWDPGTREQRLAALAALYRWSEDPTPGRAPLVVAPVRGVLTRTLPPAAFAAEARVVRAGERVRLTGLLERLQRLGYRFTTSVTEAGQVAHRGGIVDVFPPSEPHPVRMEWFGDEIESLRRFDRVSQRSSASLDELTIVPASEALLGNGANAAATLGEIDTRRLHPLAESELRRQREHLRRGEPFDGLEFYLPLLHPGDDTVLGFLPESAWIVADQLDRLATTALTALDQAQVVRREQIEANELPAGWAAEPLASWATVEAVLARSRLLDVGLIGRAPESPRLLADRFGSPAAFGGNIEEAVTAIVDLTEAGRAVVVVSRQAPRIVELLGDLGLHVAVTSELATAPGAGGLAVVHGALGAGWTLGDADRVGTGRLGAEGGLDHTAGGTSGGSARPPIWLLTDADIFGWRMPHRRRPVRAAEPARPVDYFAEYTPGDYVVHIEHGIGVFRGIERMQVGTVERDYLKVEYAQGDVLYVPTHQADRVARYVGTGEIDPPVTRLGTADWERAKARARRAVEDIARELLALYARRESARRAAFAPDTAWQAEMEAAFPYLETPDQIKAIEDVKGDMESQRPMDRLVVGDVGFGKTEVALRAAFKAVMAGRQVAVLAPTTVLVQQHHETFTRRLAAFPVRVASLSRFRGRKEQAEILDKLATREVDIVIGTHRLLSADVHFKDLGLLIIDEEHRFGVKHKERLRQLRENVDTLTLTATPIPRTMHMALTGLRDLTTIDTPPEERLPVVTHVGPYDDNLVRQAIRREMGRRGQVFYVFNRVRGIEMVAQKVLRLVPEARVGTAHGQMNQDALARAMLEFVGGNVDVLVCTSIVESGLDIANANTLILEHAERFGLAQLHQLRGRVGRSAQRAYAYFLHPPGVELPDDARDRLEALAEASRLGSGFHIAMRDLEIRGAGEILGARQHGQVAAIGLDLYTRLLAEAIKQLKADGPPDGGGAGDGAADGPAGGLAVEDRIVRELAAIDPGTLPTVDLPLDAYLPEHYVPETGERTRLYRRMAAASDLDAVREIEHEIKDRFGAPPLEVQNLIDVLWLRVLAHLAGARNVGREDTDVAIRWGEKHAIDRILLRHRLDRDLRVGQHQITVPLAGRPEQWLPRVRRALETAVEIEGPRLPRSL